MSIRNLLVAVPFALGIACSHSSSSKAHTGAMWTEQRGDSSDGGAQAAKQQDSNQATSGSVQTTSGTMMAASGQDPGAAGGASSGDSSGAAGASGAGAASGSQGSSTSQGDGMGSGGSSETMGTDKPEQGSGSGSASGSQMGTGSDMGAHAGDHTVAGKISKVSKDEVTIAPKSGEPMTLKISDQTTVMMHGKTAKPSQLKKGEWVHATYQEVGGDQVAVKIDSGKGHKSASSGHMKGTGSGGSGSSGSGSSGSSNQ